MKHIVLDKVFRSFFCVLTHLTCCFQLKKWFVRTYERKSVYLFLSCQSRNLISVAKEVYSGMSRQQMRWCQPLKKDEGRKIRLASHSFMNKSTRKGGAMKETILFCTFFVTRHSFSQTSSHCFE
jgi:hypothetical protein